jgi:8-oxo-dGTP pyrophosphatase MutT (NUDIX family)
VSSRFEQTDSETVYDGSFITLEHRTYRHEDGEEVERDVVVHPGAVGVVVLDADRLWLVRQPREAVGSPDLLELPAGKLDEEGESPLETAQRELAEEIGLAARSWHHLTSCYSSPGFTNEEIHVYLATDLYEIDADRDPGERIEIRTVPLSGLDGLIRECRDAKTLVGLLWLKAMLD